MRLTDRIGVAYISSRWFGEHLQIRAMRGFGACAFGLAPANARFIRSAGDVEPLLACRPLIFGNVRP